MKQPAIKNNIIESGEMPAAQFLAHPENWRIHSATQQDVVGGLLDELGWIDRVTISARTGTVLNGHLRVKLALQRGDDTPVPYDAVDLTPGQEALALAMLDKSGDLAITDPVNLQSILDQAEADNTTVLAYIDDIISDNAQWVKATSHEGQKHDIDTLKSSIDRNPAVQIKVVIQVNAQLDTIERALKATGRPNRGQALEAMAAFYLAANGTTSEKDESRFSQGRRADWDALAESVRRRDGYICQRCGKSQDDAGRRLDVHHIIPYRVSHDNRESNLISLCYSCHNIAEYGDIDALKPRQHDTSPEDQFTPEPTSQA